MREVLMLNRKLWLAQVALLAFSGREALAGRPVSLEDYYRLEDIGDPEISPDGRWVAFVRTVVIEAENRRNSEIWLAPADGSAAPTRLTHPSFSSSKPRRSPDGSLLAFESNRKAPGHANAGSVWFLRMDAARGEAFEIPGVEGTPVFSPDNRFIAFTKKTPPANRRHEKSASDFERRIHERFTGRMYDWMNFRFDQRGYLPDPRDPQASPPLELYLVPRKGGTPHQLTRLGVLRTVVYSASDPTHPNEIHVAAPDGSGEKKLTGFNDTLAGELDLSRAERVSFPSRDGTEIEGWVLPPRGFDPTKGPYPLILRIHGGPHSAYGNEFSCEPAASSRRGSPGALYQSARIDRLRRAVSLGHLGRLGS
jgi:dipeptidyl aminopeptidase/acylaminoacyl peptidase